MNRYGQQITWGPLSAPRLFTGVTRDYSYRDSVTKQLIQDMAADHMAMVLHSKKGDINFEAMVTDASADFLDLSGGAAITVSGIATGMTLVRRAVEIWRLGQPKMANIQATHYPHMTGAAGTPAGTMSAVTPEQGGLSIVYPGQKLVYSTAGLTHASGIVHGLTLEQSLQITEDEPSPDGEILGAASHAYERTIKLELLATADIPAVDTVLAIGGAPNHANSYRITGANQQFYTEKGKMYVIEAAWIPAFAA